MDGGIVVAWEQGELRIRQPGEDIRIRLQPAPVAEERTFRGAWREYWPAFRLVKPAAETIPPAYVFDPCPTGADAELRQRLNSARDAFRAALPPGVADHIDRFGCHQWCFLKLLMEERDILELAASNRVLAWCLANNAEFQRTALPDSLNLARHFSRRKQRAIAEWLGFPGTEPVVRLLKKITPEAAHPSLLRRLQFVLARDQTTLGLLSNLPAINAGMLEIVIAPTLSKVVTPELMRDVARNPGDYADGRLIGMLHDALTTLSKIAPARRVRLPACAAQIPEFARAVRVDAEAFEQQQAERRRREQEYANARALERQQLEQQRREQNRALRRRRNRNRPALVEIPPPVDGFDRLPTSRPERFPTPPIPGTPEIIPITTMRDLTAEGERQHHCVAVYWQSIVAGVSYIYSVYYPERATLQICRVAGGRWVRHQIRGCGNATVRDSTKNFVDGWLARHFCSTIVKSVGHQRIDLTMGLLATF